MRQARLTIVVMVIGHACHIQNIKMCDNTLIQAKSFKYLGVAINEHTTLEEDIKNRIAKCRHNLTSLCILMKDGNEPNVSYTELHQTVTVIQGVVILERRIIEDLYGQRNILRIIQVTDKNKLRCFGHGVER